MRLPVELEAAITATPEDPAPWLVAADWLQARGDPQGELITLMRALEGEQSPARFLSTRASRDALLRLHGEALVGGAQLDDVRWRWGHVTHARLEVEHLDALLGSPAGRWVRELELHGPLEDAAASLVRHAPPLLTGLGLVGAPRGAPVVLRALLPRGITRLVVDRVEVDFVGADLSALTDLRLRDVHHPSVTPLITSLDGPLQTLELFVDAPLQLKLSPLNRLQHLRTLRLEDDLADDLAVWAATANLTHQLHTLALCGPMTDVGLDALLHDAARLQSLDLWLEGGAFSGTLRRLAYKRLPKVVFQKTRSALAWWPRQAQ